MKLVVLSVVCLWGALFLCGSVSSSSNAEIMKEAALAHTGHLACEDKFDCDCTFNRQRGCCCAANQMFALENATFYKMMSLWHQISLMEVAVKEVTENIEVSFAATMEPSDGDCFGPFTTNISITYSVIRLNQGYGYNPALGDRSAYDGLSRLQVFSPCPGVFTAPRAGVYVFTFTAYSNVGINPVTGMANRLYHKVQMMKNGEVVASMWEDNREDMEDSGTQVVLLQLTRGSQVYMELKEGRKLCGSKQELNFFSGYLLYPDLAQ